MFEPPTALGSELFSYLTCLDTAIYILLSIFSVLRDDYFINLKESTVLACEPSTSGFRPWLENVTCFSSLTRPIWFVKGVVHKETVVLRRWGSSENEEITLETSAFRILVQWSIYVINSFDKTKFFFYYFTGSFLIVAFVTRERLLVLI